MQTKPALWRRTWIPALFLFSLVGLFFSLKRAGRNDAGAAVPAPVGKDAIPDPRPTAIDDGAVASLVRVARGEIPADYVVPMALQLNDSGSKKSFVLSLDQVSIRTADGMDHLRALSPAATRETYIKRVRALEGEGQVMPVLYPDGEEPTPYNRRLVTSSVLVVVPENIDRDTIPGALHLATEMVPATLPKHIVMKAVSPLAALAGLDIWNSLANVKTAEVLLAKQQQKRAVMPNDTLIANQWHLKAVAKTGVVAGTDVNIEDVWNYPSTTPGTFIRGGGIRVGIVDDGLQVNHPDLSANVDTENDKDWNGGASDFDPSPGPDDNHGTACAGNVAARGNNNLGVSGTAPEAKLVGMRLISAAVSDAQEAEAMEYLNNIIFVKSNSWGPNDTKKVIEGPGDLTKAALENAATAGRGGKGTIILWAGGNGGSAADADNSNFDGYANSIYTIAIGATDSLGNRAYYSEPGANLIVSSPSLGASPSLGITTVDRTGNDGYNSAGADDELSDVNYTQLFSGTSSATPTAAGIVALMLEKNPALGWRDVQEILIRSAKKIKPTDAGWVDNKAGFHFHHDFGGGLIDAKAAVTMAGTWTNLAPQTTGTGTLTGSSPTLPLQILNENSAGVGKTLLFNVPSNIRAEQVTVRLKITHSARGNLAITLTSPLGTASKLTEVRSDSADDYDWTFMTTRNWGEIASGDWQLNIADRSSTGNSTGGTVTLAEVKVFGSPGVPVNPPPLVQITSPSDGASYSPGAAVNFTVSASDTVIGGGVGVVSMVQLLDSGGVVGTKTSPPYTFSLNPALGSHAYVARATDSEGATANSPVVNITLVNQPPVITAATIGNAVAYDDTVIPVSGITASDPDGPAPTISYQWQSSDDGITFTNVAGLITATLPADPSRSGLKWRCALTASDGTASSAVFYTNAVNLLDRPVTAATAGAAYSYQSGLVLPNGGAPVTRDAIINEFSQGASGASEWVEILVLKQASLRKWAFKDSNSGQITFQDSEVWDAVPAGTRIVIYNQASRDALLPAADDTNFADRVMILPSNNTTFFSATAWPALGNGGDSIYLLDGDGATVAQVAYGTSTVSPNVGAVGGGKAAYYAGDSDEGAGVADNWSATSGSTVRARAVTRALGDLFISEYVEGSRDDKAIELYNPTSSAVNLTTDVYKLEIYSNGSSSASPIINLTGTVAPGGTFVVGPNSASATLLPYLTVTSNISFFNGNDALLLKKNGVIVDSFGQVGNNPNAAGWGSVTMDRTLRRKASVVQGDVIPTDTFDPTVEWEVFPNNTFSGLGSHGSAPSTPALSVSLSPGSFSENGGTSTGTVAIAAAAAADVVIALASSDTAELTVPASVTIPAGQTSATFPITAVDDTNTDGPSTVTISATATGYASGSAVATVTDDEVTLDGVTPGAGNTPANIAWINSLASGTAGNPAAFSLAAGSTLPAGLTLDPLTGLISGNIDPAASGSFPIVIERNNGAETVSQSFTLEVSAGATVSYASWVGGFSGLSSIAQTADPDGDGLANLVEYYLGLAPNARDADAIVAAKAGNTLSITYPRSLTASGITAQVEWSATLATDSWSTVGLTSEIIPSGGPGQVIKTSLALTPGDLKKFLRIKVTAP